MRGLRIVVWVALLAFYAILSLGLGWKVAQEHDMITGLVATTILVVTCGAAHWAMGGFRVVSASGAERFYRMFLGTYIGEVGPGLAVLLPWLETMETVSRERTTRDIHLRFRTGDGELEATFRVLENVEDVRVWVESTTPHTFTSVVEAAAAAFITPVAAPMTTRDFMGQIAATLAAMRADLTTVAAPFGVMVHNVSLKPPGLKITSQALAEAWERPAAAALNRDAAVLDADAARAREAAHGLAEAEVRAAEVASVMAALKAQLGSDAAAQAAFTAYQEVQEAAKRGGLSIRKEERVHRFEGLPAGGGGMMALASLVGDILTQVRGGAPAAPAPVPPIPPVTSGGGTP